MQPNETTTTKMIAPEGPKTKMVKIRAKSPIRLDRGKDTVSLAEGEVAEVTEAEAKEFCDKKFDAGFDFGGERSVQTSTRHTIVRAERVQ